MSIGVLLPVEKEPEKCRAAKASTVYKCIMVKYNIDSEVDDKDIHIKIAYTTVDYYVPLCKDFKNKSKNIYIPKYTPIPHQVFKISFKFM